MTDLRYTHKSLTEKLGYRPEETVLLINAPLWFAEYLDMLAITPAVKPPANWGHAFCTTEAELQSFCKRIDLSQIEKGWWMSWPKKSSGIRTDLTEQMFRDYILPLGWVDTKVCLIDETWSGLKFLRRKT